jgi:hypothetical protein
MAPAAQYQMPVCRFRIGMKGSRQYQAFKKADRSQQDKAYPLKHPEGSEDEEQVKRQERRCEDLP